MKKKFALAFVILGICIFSFPPSTARAQGTAFTYEGQLQNNGSPANGNYDFTFALFNNNGTNTGQIGGTQTNLGVGVTNGLFTALLDFGNVFDGESTWVAISGGPMAPPTSLRSILYRN